MFDLAVDDQGYKWMVLGSSSAGVLLFDEGELDDPNDDRCRVFTANNSELATNMTTPNLCTTDHPPTLVIDAIRSDVAFTTEHHGASSAAYAQHRFSKSRNPAAAANHRANPVPQLRDDA